MTIDNNNIETCHTVLVNLPVPIGFITVKLDFVECMGSQINNIDITRRNLPFGSDIVFKVAEQMEQHSLDYKMPHCLAMKPVQDIVSMFVSYSFHSKPPRAFSPQDDAKMPEKPSNCSYTSSTYTTPGCEACANRRENPKMRLRFDSKPIFTVFSRAAVCLQTSTWEEPSSRRQSSQSYSATEKPRAIIEWKDAAGNPIETYTEYITTTGWHQYTKNFTPFSSSGKYLSITFRADAGSYAYISSTSFGGA